MELCDWLKPVGLGAAVTLMFILTNFVSVISTPGQESKLINA